MVNRLEEVHVWPASCSGDSMVEWSTELVGSLLTLGQEA
jgi:hypothetical protein